MEVIADFSADDETTIDYEEICCSGDFEIRFSGAGQDLSIRLSDDQHQKLLDLLVTWGYSPSEEAMAEIKKIESERG